MVVASEVPVCNAFERLPEDVLEALVINQEIVITQQADPVVQGDVQALGSQAGTAILVSSMPSSSTFNDRSDLPLSPAGGKDFMLHDVNAVQAQGSNMGDPGYVSSKGVHLSLGSKDAILCVHGAELAQAEGPCRNGDGAAASSSPTEPVARDVDGEENPLLVHGNPAGLLPHIDKSISIVSQKATVDNLLMPHVDISKDGSILLNDGIFTRSKAKAAVVKRGSCQGIAGPGGEAKEEEISWGEEPFKLSSPFFKF
ncbi:hypothetical protein Taro_000606 [Colocasia esculenta]|uniref:Uncharacterized protein n=1 Tax=Colocasia esculenta TaxID=4460 RepID=A0A843TFE9_COLES|nr:hypothetical protein [Colocasia esculenta]